MLLQAEQMYKMTTISLKIVEVLILSKNSCHFVSCSAWDKSLVKWAKQPKTLDSLKLEQILSQKGFKVWHYKYLATLALKRRGGEERETSRFEKIIEKWLMHTHSLQVWLIKKWMTFSN
jgi:hypothetical protein